MLRARCLAVRGAIARYGGALQLTDAEPDVARAVLEYLYSDHSPIEELGARGIELLEQAPPRRFPVKQRRESPLVVAWAPSRSRIESSSLTDESRPAFSSG